MVLGGAWSSPGALLSTPGLLWGTFLVAWGNEAECFWMMFASPGGVQGENNEKLDVDDPLNENVIPKIPT